MYRDSLKKLKEQVFAVPQSSEAKPSRGFIQARVETKPLSEPRTTPYADWLQTIASMASEIRESTSKTVESQGSFAEGFASTVSFEKPSDGLATVPEENKEALIRRRGDLPSLYAPRASKEENSHEARINGNSGGYGGFKELMDKYEGGGEYDTLYEFSNKEGRRFANVDITKMTIGELKQFANGEYGAWSKQRLGYKATPMGRYQFVGSTLSAVAKKMGLPDDTVFDQATQDAMFDFHIKDTISKGKSVDEKVNLLRGQWEGFKNVPKSVLADLVVKYG